MTKEELKQKIESSRLYYESCVNEWSILQDEFSDAEEECEKAEETLITYKRMLQDWDTP